MEPKPKSLNEVDFFTRQILESDGFVFMWVYKPICPDCGKTRLKKLKKRDKVYTCESCKKTFTTEQYNSLLKYNIEYTCPNCKKEGKDYGDWIKPKNKSAKVVLKFICEHCGTKLKVIRMKKQKPKN